MKWTEPPKLGLVVTYAPLEVGAEDAPQLLEQGRAALSRLPIDTAVADTPVSDVATALQAARELLHAHVDAVAWLAATWAFDSLALEFLRTCPVPLAAWGVPGIETGSVCGAQQLVHVLTELDRPRTFIHGAVDDPAAHDAIVRFVRGAAAAQRLKQARFGMLGHRTVGMTEVTFHEYDLMRQFGALVYYQGLHELHAAMDRADAREAETVWTRLKGRCGACTVDGAAGLTAARCYLALRQWIDADRLNGIAVGCYPDLMGIVCLGCGLLAEEGVVTACEGDMNSTILTAAMHLMSGRPIHNTDFLFADTQDNTCTLSHCGNSAVMLADDERQVALEPARLVNRGVVTRYTAAPGRVTLANLCGARGSYRLACYTGEAVPTGNTFPGIPVRVKLDVPVDQFLRETAAFGAGHHWMVAGGDHAASLAAFAQLTRLTTSPTQC